MRCIKFLPWILLQLLVLSFSTIHAFFSFNWHNIPLVRIDTNYVLFSRHQNDNEEQRNPEINKANEFRARAKELRAEARAMELALWEHTAKQRKERDVIIDELISKIFLHNNMTATTKEVESDGKRGDDEEKSVSIDIAMLPNIRVIEDRLKHGGLSRQQISSIVDRLYQNPRKNSTLKDYVADQKFDAQLNKVMHSQDVEQRLRILAEETNSNRSDGSNGTIARVTSFVPMWVPARFVPYIISLNKSSSSQNTLGYNEIDIFKNDVLLGSRFYLTSCESISAAALFRGNVRTSLNEPSNPNKGNYERDDNTALVFADIQKRLQKAGLADNIQLFLLPDPQEVSGSKLMRPKATILALPKSLSPDESILNKSLIRKIGQNLCYPLAAVSTFMYAFSMHILNPHFFNSLVQKRDLTILYSCIPTVLGVVFIQTIHEAAHYLVAKRRKIKIGLPVPIPSPHIDSFPFFGCITPMKSFPPNRAFLLDFALSGPITALAVSLGFVLRGIALTSRACDADIAKFPVISVANMKSSFLLGSILSCLLPKTIMLPLAQPIPMHPFFMVGRSGLISSALNLLPVFRLDGGRAAFSAMGHQLGGVISAITTLWLISLILSGASSVLLSWTLLISLLQIRMEIPCCDEYTKVGTRRVFIWLVSVLLSISILVPFPK